MTLSLRDTAQLLCDIKTAGVLCYLIQGRDTLIEITIALVGESREDSLRLAEILLRGHKLSRIAVM